MAGKFHSLSTGLRPEAFDVVMAAAGARGLTISALLREGLRALNIPVPTTAQERSRLATKPNQPMQPRQPTPPSRSVAITGLTPHARLCRLRRP
ncbi:hypothetical protein [Roseococcus sp.]|uniref:hypothetical protein n=1 Tax=Roseococcus sp. TaxID=2109646 RepID=UPI003BAB628F